MIARTRRDPYKTNAIRTYNELKQYFYDDEINYIVSKEEGAINKPPEIAQCKSRVWLMFASSDANCWDCVQVAQSKDALNEIKDAIDYSLDFVFGNGVALDNSLFYENVCPKLTGEQKKEYSHYLYSMIGREYEHIKICQLDVDKYLGINVLASNDVTEAERLIEICKNQYAEALIAYQTMAVYWNSYRSGVDGQLISYIADHRDEFDIERHAGTTDGDIGRVDKNIDYYWTKKEISINIREDWVRFMEIKEYTKYNSEEIFKLYQAVGWTAYTGDMQSLEQGYKNSLLTLAAYEGDELLGIIRTVGDGYTIVFVQDILVFPKHQRKGVGTALLRAVLERFEHVRQIELATDNTPKTVAFYKSLGFSEFSEIGCCGFMRC